MLGVDEIKRHLRTRWAAGEIVYKEVTDSTNDDARELAKTGACHGTLVVADKQEAGRGSSGRKWETPAGSNIAMSLVVRPDVFFDRVPMLTLVMGLSVAEGIDLAIRETVNGQDAASLDGEGHPTDCRIKWPNDVVIGDRKVCGILTELHMSTEGKIGDVVIGVGINVNIVDFPDDIKGVAGSLLTQTGVRADRSLVVACVMERFEDNYEKFAQKWDMSLLREQYEQRLINKDRRVMLLDLSKASLVAPASEVEKLFEDGGDEQGVALGITDMGALRIGLDDGTVREVHAGDVSVRGIYGYV